MAAQHYGLWIAEYHMIVLYFSNNVSLSELGKKMSYTVGLMVKYYKHWLEDTINHIDKHSLMMAHDTYTRG
jgi:hypothetical protein